MERGCQSSGGRCRRHRVRDVFVAIGFAVFVSLALRMISEQQWFVSVTSGAAAGMLCLLGAIGLCRTSGPQDLDRLSLACVLLDEQRQLLWANHAACAWLHLHCDHCLGRHWTTLFAADNTTADWPEEGVCWADPRADGVRLAVRYQLVPLNGALSARPDAKYLLLLSAADHLLADLREQTESRQLQTAASLASQIAHEIRNPVTAISCSAQLLGRLSERARTGDSTCRQLLIEEQDALCRAIADEALRLDAIVARYLSFVDLSESSLRALMDIPDEGARTSDEPTPPPSNG